MRHFLIVLTLVFMGKWSFSQKKKATSKDTIKTEVIDVITSYKPKVTDASKIRKNPSIKRSEKSRKKQLDYRIFSVPVASTFIPKSGTLKGLYLSRTEQLYHNYLALGFGNNRTPFAEAFIEDEISYQSSWGIYARYISSEDGVKNTALNSSFSKLLTNLYYQQQERDFSWKTGLDFQREGYHWYGLPNLNFDNSTLGAIASKQNYTFIQPTGEIHFENSFINSAKLSISYLFDRLKSSEYAISLRPQFQIPLSFLTNNSSLLLSISADYLGGKFSRTYKKVSSTKYGFITLGANPTYLFKYQRLTMKLGGKFYFTSDTQRKISQFIAYPTVDISYLITPLTNVYIGSSGDLHNNSYKQYIDKNPYLSPTLTMTQTNEKYHLFGGVNGKVIRNISYSLKASYKNEEDKPLFAINKSKSDGTTVVNNGVPLLGYEYGNSFSVIYDDVKTLSVFGEIELAITKDFTLGANGQVNRFKLKHQRYPWNLPKMKGEIFGKYNANRWYASAHILFVGNRRSALYNGAFSLATVSRKLKRYADVNINGGYHFSDHIAVFLRLNNILNNPYERFENFEVQGFQILGGFIWKFDL